MGKILKAGLITLGILGLITLYLFMAVTYPKLIGTILIMTLTCGIFYGIYTSLESK